MFHTGGTIFPNNIPLVPGLANTMDVGRESAVASFFNCNPQKLRPRDFVAEMVLRFQAT
jgi:hypothetical protein